MLIIQKIPKVQSNSTKIQMKKNEMQIAKRFYGSNQNQKHLCLFEVNFNQIQQLIPSYKTHLGFKLKSNTI